MAQTSHLWGFSFYRDTYMIPVLIVPQILMSTKQKCHRYFLLSHFFFIFKNYPNYMKHQKLVQISENKLIDVMYEN